MGGGRALHIYDSPELKPANQLMLLINTIIPVTSAQWWFISAYFVLFFFIPVLNKYISALNKRNSIIALALVWIFWYSPTIFSFTFSNLQKAVFFYLTGALIKKYNFSFNKWIALGVFVIMWCVFWGTDILNSALLENSDIKSKIMKLIYSGLQTAICVPLAVISLFSFFRNLKIRESRFINTVASTTFGVYLIHDSTIGRQLIWNKIFHCLDVQYTSEYFLVLAIASSLCVFCVCSFIDYLRQIVFEKRYLPFIYKKLEQFKEKNRLP